MKKVSEPYLIAFDMDGTLLDTKKRISFKTAHLIKKLSKQGHKIVISSGRPIRSIISYYNKLGLDTPMVCYNGELVYSPCDKNFEEERHTIPKEIILEILEKIKPNALNIMCETDDEIFVDKEDAYLGKFFWYTDMKIHKGNIKDILNKNAMTFIVHCPKEYKNANEIEKIVSKWPELTPIFWIGSPYFELHHKETSKGTGIKKIAEYYNIPRDRVIAFGDATNDIEMFEYAKTSVLMSNAKFDLKDKVTMVSLKDNDHNGIYYTLKKILKSKEEKKIG